MTLYMECSSIPVVLPYYDLLMAARSALSHPCLQYSIACMQVFDEKYESGAAGGEQSEPPCLYLLHISVFVSMIQVTLIYELKLN